MQFVLTLGKNSLIVPALILPSAIMTAVLVLLLEFVVPLAQVADWAVLAISLAYFAVVIFLTLQVVGSTSCRVEIAEVENGMSFHFLDENIFHRKDFTLSYSDIYNIGEDNDKGYDFLYFTTAKQGYKKFHLTAKENDQGFGAFRAIVLGKVESYNSSVSVQHRIASKTIYQKWPMITLAVLMVVFLVAYPLAAAFLGSSWLDDLKYWVMVVVSVPIVGKVYYQNFRQQ